MTDTNDHHLARLMEQAAPEPPTGVDFGALQARVRRRRTATVAAMCVGTVLTFGAVAGIMVHFEPKPASQTTAPIPASDSGSLAGSLLLVGGPAPGMPVPRPGTVHVVSSDGSIDLTTKAGPDGRWEIDVPPGNYVVRATSPGYLSTEGSHDACGPAHNPVRVTVDRQTSVDVYCQMR